MLPCELWALCLVVYKGISYNVRNELFQVFFFFLAAIIFISHFTSVIKTGLVGI